MTPTLQRHAALVLPVGLVAVVLCLALLGCTAAADEEPGPDPWADVLVSFTPGAQAGFGAAQLPDVVLGPPRGGGTRAGSTDVVSLGRSGTIVVAFDDVGLIDGPGADLLVFENPFSGFVEAGRVSVSADGLTWFTWPCSGDEADLSQSQCAGVGPVLANAAEAIDLQSLAEVGGDAFDLQDLGLAAARFVRIEDTGKNSYAGSSGGFDLDAVAVRNGAPLP